jgi:RimJ/RimL family protein N-acetyltransferase
MNNVKKNETSFEVRPLVSLDYPFLVAMYDAFVPKGSFNGLPPETKDIRDNWINGVINVGPNFLAWREFKVIGHVAIFPYYFNHMEAEFLIFVSQKFRGIGVGKALTDTIIEKAKEIHLKRIWLSVDACNYRAIHLYRKAGFTRCLESSSMTEWVMAMEFDYISPERQTYKNPSPLVFPLLKNTRFEPEHIKTFNL